MAASNYLNEQSSQALHLVPTIELERQISGQ
jgi:hypothetical protein